MFNPRFCEHKMTDKARECIDTLDLTPLEPEGGFFKEVARSPNLIQTPYGTRNQYTSIFYMMTPEIISSPHRLKSDEMWYYHSGDPVVLYLYDKGHGEIHRLSQNSPFVLVPAGSVQAARPVSEEAKEGFSLVSCVVSPGFDFKDYANVRISDDPSLLSFYREFYRS